MTVHSLQVLF